MKNTWNLRKGDKVIDKYGRLRTIFTIYSDTEVSLYVIESNIKEEEIITDIKDLRHYNETN